MKEKKVFNVDKFNEGLAAVHKRTEEELQELLDYLIKMLHFNNDHYSDTHNLFISDRHYDQLEDIKSVIESLLDLEVQ